MIGIYLAKEGAFNFGSGEKQTAETQANATNQTSSNQTSENKTAEAFSIKLYKNCSAVNGTICSESQSCPAKWLEVSNTFNCCSSNCSAQNKSATSIELFELNPEDSEFEEII
jgi:hypothetical protein